MPTHQLSPINFQQDGGAATILSGIVQQSINTGTIVIKEFSSATIFPESTELVGVNVGASFATNHIEQAIGLVPWGTGLCIDAGVSEPGMQMYAKRRTCGLPEIGAVSERFTVANGVVVPRALTASHQGNSQISFDVFAVSPDGGTTPSIVQATAATPAVGAFDSARWTISRVDIQGSVFTGFRSLDIQFNFSVSQDGADSELEPRTAAIEGTTPRIVLRGIDVVSWFSSLTLDGAVLTNALTHIFLKRRGFAVGASEHIRLDIAGVAHVETVFDASGHATAESDLILEPVDDGTNDPIATTLNTTIP